MRNILRLLLLCPVLLAGSLHSQSFSYSFSNSTSTYTELIDSSSHAISDLWSTNQVLPIGFELNVAGTVFESFTLTPKGVLIFDSLQRFNFVGLLKNFYPQTNENAEIISSIWYQNITDDGHNILKIEFRDIAFDDTASNKVNVSFQIWIKQENNTVEFHMGSVSGLVNDESCMVGLINMFDTVNYPLGYMISGSPSAPVATAIPSNGTPVSLTTVPAVNTVYSFTYSN